MLFTVKKKASEGTPHRTIGKKLSADGLYLINFDFCR
jgi:hypothetical protein